MPDMPIQLGSKETDGELDECDWLNEGILIFQGPLIKFPTRAKCDTHQSLSASNWCRDVTGEGQQHSLEWHSWYPKWAEAPLQNINPSTDAIQISFIDSGHLLSRVSLVLKHQWAHICRRTINLYKIFIYTSRVDKFRSNQSWILTWLSRISGTQKMSIEKLVGLTLQKKNWIGSSSRDSKEASSQW